MAYDAHANFAYSTVATAPSPASSGTSLVVQTGDGANFPAAPFNATVWPAGSQPTKANSEIVRVTAIATDTFTITRTQESSSARTIVTGDQIAATITAKTLTDIEANATGSSSQTIYASESHTFESIDAFKTTNSVGTGSVTFDASNGLMLALKASAANDQADMYRQLNQDMRANTLPTKHYGLTWLGFAGSAGSGDAYWRWYSSSNGTSIGTANQIGIHVNKNAGVITPYSSTGDGTTEQAITISGLTINFGSGIPNKYSFDYDGTTVHIYVDGVLKNSHSTNVPGRTSSAIINFRPLANVTATTANAFWMTLGGSDFQYPMF